MNDRYTVTHGSFVRAPRVDRHEPNTTRSNLMTKKQLPSPSLKDGIAAVLAAEDRSKASCAPMWLAVLRAHEAEAVTLADDWSDGAQAHFELYSLAKADHEARKVAIATNTQHPAQPFRDRLARRNEMATSTKARQTSTGGSKRGRSVTYWLDEREITRRYFLGFMANEATKRILRDDRMSTDEFRALLAKLGVAEPEHSTWHFALPNGRKVGATLPSKSLPKATDVTSAQCKAIAIDKVSTVTPASKAKGAAAKTNGNGTVTKVTVAQAEKAAAKKAAAKRKAAPKKSVRKGGAASKPLAKPMAPRKSVAARKATKRVTRKR